MHITKTRLWLLAASSVLLVLLALGAAVVWFLSTTVPLFDSTRVTNIEEYAHCRRFLGKTSSHFPPSVPSEATQASMLFQSGALQGSNTFELRFVISPEKASEIIAGFPAGKELQTPLRDTYAGKSFGLLAPAPGSSSPPLERLVPQYRVFMLHDTGSWNHPNLGGVLIDEKAGEVLYFAEH